MAAMTTVLTEFADNGNSRTYTLAGHTAVKPKLVIQRRVVATAPNASPEDSFDIVVGTSDADSAVLPGRIAFSVKVRRPIQGQATDVTAALATLKDIVNSDEFANTVTTQEWMK